MKSDKGHSTSLRDEQLFKTPTFETWLRTVCFQKPTPEAYDLAKCAWEAASHPSGTIGGTEHRLREQVRELVAALEMMYEAYEGVYDMATPTEHQSAEALYAEKCARSALDKAKETS